MFGRKTASFLVVLLTALGCLGWTPTSGHDRAVELLVALSASGRAAAPASDVHVEEFTVPGLPRARLYRSKTVRKAIVLAHGVHARGIDEPRFVRFATELAKLQIAVVTPSLPSLSEYRVKADSVGIIGSAVRSVSARPDLAPSGKVGLIGISFGGGLSLVAASRPDVRDQLEYVASIGGHHDLSRVLRFWLTNQCSTPEGVKAMTAHEYGPAVLAYDHVDDLVPAREREAVRAAFRAWLAEDRSTARRLASELASSEARELFALLETNALGSLSGRLLALVEARKGELAELSPGGKLSSIRAPVYLLHGSEDRLIPAAELSWAARELEHARAPHRALVTSLIEHVTPDRPASLFEKLALVDFMASML